MATEAAYELISCASHGNQRLAFVCNHIVLQLHDNVPRGVLWSFSQDDQSFSAYCSDCASLMTNESNEIPDDAFEKMEPKLICELCLDRVLQLNGQTRLN
jgi:hypothetical protein